MLMRSMEKARAQRVSGEGGFTLVELLVVIAILGVLAGIVVFAVGGINNNSQTAANNTDCSVLRTAEEAYFATNNSYVLDTTAPPKTAQDLLKAGGFLRTEDSKTITAPTPAQVAAGEKDYVISGC